MRLWPYLGLGVGQGPSGEVVPRGLLERPPRPPPSQPPGELSVRLGLSARVLLTGLGQLVDAWVMTAPRTAERTGR
jgi:hypothetical protein